MPANSQYRISPWLISWLYPLASYIVLPLYFRRLTVVGQENIPKSGPVIVAPTHRSRWDAVIIPYAVGRLVSGRDVWFMVMASEMRGFQGWLIRRLGGFPVDVERPGLESLSYSVELLCRSQMLVIFPEGGIFRENRIHRLKRGVARIALEVEAKKPGAGMKILPVSVQYSQPYPACKTDVAIGIGSPINVADYSSDFPKQASTKLTAALTAALNHLQGGTKLKTRKE